MITQVKTSVKWVAAAGSVAAIFVLSMCVGRFPLAPPEVVQSLLQGIFGIDYGMEADALSVVLDNRLPRACAGALVGAALAASGCAFQGLFQNPLVSQGILGVSSGASFGAALSILLFSTTIFTPWFAFAFALLAVFFSFMVARMCGEVSTLMLVLGGIIVSAIFSSLLSLLKYVADPYNQLASIVFWNMGSLASIESSVMPFGSFAMLLGMVLLLLSSWALNVLSMGDREAKSMGLSVPVARGVVVAGASLATAGAVCIAGTVGWVGLVIPHIARFLVGSDNRVVVPFSMLIGAAFMMFIDILSRTLTGSEIPLGILTSLIGAPFFIYLLRRYKGRGWR